jgi:hypothetical protein
MDEHRFDAIARGLGGVRTRRGVVGAVMAALGGGTVAVAAGLPGAALTPTRASAHEPSRLDPGPGAWAVVRHYPYVQPPQPILDAFHGEYIAAACASAGFHNFYAIDTPWMPPADSGGSKPGDPLGVIITMVVFETCADYDAFAPAEADWLAGLAGTILPEPLQEHAGPVALAHHHDPHTCGICGRVCPAEAPPAACVPDCGDRVCGDDGCGGTCGACAGDETCGDGVCLCGGDLCDGTCCGGACIDLDADTDHCGACDAACAAGEVCSSGVCACTPDCNGKTCGDDGCGGTCGTCTLPELCDEGACRLACTNPARYDAYYQNCGLTIEGIETYVCNYTRPGGSTTIPCVSTDYCQTYLGIQNVDCLVMSGDYYGSGSPSTWDFSPNAAICVQDYSADVC